MVPWGAMRRSWADRSLGVMRALEGGVEGFVDFAHLLGGFVDEFQAVVADAGVPPGVEVGAGFLGFGAEDGVAAADVG